MSNIITDNYTVQRYFDNITDGLSSEKYISKEKALSIMRGKRKSHYTSYEVIEHISIIGIVPFNSHDAYVFNIKPPICKNTENEVIITGGVYEDLMCCYVYGSFSIDKNILKKLTDEYYNRGGVKYSKYHGFEDIILKPERNVRQRFYRDEIIESIFKHQFREVGKNKWSNKDSVTIHQLSTQKVNMKYWTVENHFDLKIDLNNIILIGSMFGKYSISYNQLSENKIGVVCNKKDRHKYNFTYFEIHLNNNKYE